MSHEQPMEDHVVLLGRPPLQEFLGYMHVALGNPNIAQLTNEWRKANDRVLELEVAEAGQADGIPEGPLDDSVQAKASAIAQSKVFHQSYGLVPSRFSTVDLDELVVSQRDINLAYVRSLQASWPERLSAEALFDICMPVKPTFPPVQAMRISQNAWVFSCPSTDFRFHEPTTLQPEQVFGYTPTGHMTHTIGLVLGFGSNLLSVLKFRGRHFLHNGSHRAYALRDRGVRQVPCVVQDVSRLEELQLLSPILIQNQPLFFESPRPPLLRDFFDDGLRKVVPMPRRRRQIRVSFGLEQFDVPG